MDHRLYEKYFESTLNELRTFTLLFNNSLKNSYYACDLLEKRKIDLFDIYIAMCGYEERFDELKCDMNDHYYECERYTDCQKINNRDSELKKYLSNTQKYMHLINHCNDTIERFETIKESFTQIMKEF